jgi:hypothetical protein
MTDQPTLLDIYAAFAMHALMTAHPKLKEHEVADEAFKQAEQMMHERKMHVE